MNENLLTVKELAAAAEVSTQYIYKLLKSSLKPYVKRINDKYYFDAFVVSYIKNGFPADKEKPQELATKDATLQPTDATKGCNQTETLKNKEKSQELATKDATLQPTLQPTDATKGCNLENELELLKMIVDELKQDKEALKQDKEQLTKDKEYLQSECLKWQSLLLEEKEKVKLLEAAATEQPQEPVEADAAYTEIVEQPAEEPHQEPPQSFIKKLKWLFKS